MRFGLCCGIDEAHAAIDAGFDYVEMAAVGFNGLGDRWDPSVYWSLPLEATNVFLPGSIQLFSPDGCDWRPYVERTLDRARSLAVRTMVIGSGGSRRSPDGSQQDGAFADFAAAVAELARPFGIEVAPESLNRHETNVGNDLGRLARLLLERGVGYTADSYHVLVEWDQDGRLLPLDELWVEQLPTVPTHIHIADLPRQGAPSNDSMLQGFVRRLSALGYDGRVSLECGRPSGFDLSKACSELRALFDA